MKVIDIKAMAEIEVNPSERDKIISQLTLKSKYTEEEVRLYREAGDHSRLFVPRGTIPSKSTTDKVWEESNTSFTGKLRPLQEGLTEATLTHFQDNNGGIIKAETGTGKTVIAAAIASKMKYKTLIIVPTSYLMDQWKERLSEFTDVKSIGTIIQGNCDYEHDFTIGMIHSLSKKDKYPLEMYEYFGLVVWDECIEENTLIRMANEVQRPIKDILPGDYIYGWNGKEYVCAQVEDTICVGEKEVIEIELSNGKTIQCTPEHLILTNNGYIKAIELTLGDNVCIL